MMRFKVLSALLTLFFLFAYADAQLEFCNKTYKKVSMVLLGYDGSFWLTKGWYNIEPSACKQLISKKLTNRYYYFYAHRADGSEWKDDRGKVTTCVDDKAFTFYHEDCNNIYENTRRVALRKIDIGSGNSKYRMNLTASSEPYITNGASSQ